MAVTSNTDISLNEILGQFTIPKGEYTFHPMTSGLINDTFLVSKSGSPLFVFQRINDTVFENVSGLMRNLELALTHLHGPKYCQLNLIKTLEGDSYYSSQKEPIGHWRLVAFLDQTRTFDNAPNETVAFEAGRIIGNFHVLLEKSNPAAYVDTIPRFHDLALREDQFHDALKSADSNRLTVAKNAILFAEETIATLNTMQIEELPLRVCHNDTKLNNILFSEKTNKALCLIDLDTLMAGHFLYDFGDAVRTIANSAAEDEQKHEKITFDKSLFEAFVKGLASNGQFLSKKEIHSLSTGVVLMPFLHGLRALTDYLGNDGYYKVSYSSQNLDRALSLFNFTKKALNELASIRTIINATLRY
ncbi:aminoglycoside phosphotransferase family protein [Maribacter sp.]|nr:aminoglycoside phosphotransferase family protein [Maribacter sp.]